MLSKSNLATTEMRQSAMPLIADKDARHAVRIVVNDTLSGVADKGIARRYAIFL